MLVIIAIVLYNFSPLSMNTSYVKIGECMNLLKSKHVRLVVSDSKIKSPTTIPCCHVTFSTSSLPTKTSQPSKTSHNEAISSSSQAPPPSLSSKQHM